MDRVKSLMSVDILIYQDYVHNSGILYRALCHYYGRERVGFCDAEDIMGGILGPAIHLFVMPGGADLYYCEKLNGAGNRRIRDYVEKGGNYLGICAGAYYACREIEWGKNTDQEIIGARELNFIDCLAKGPIRDFIKDGDINQSWNSAVTISVTDASEPVQIITAYSGGPVFTEIRDDTKIIASFSDLPEPNASVLEKIIGRGKVLLSSTHPENNQTDFAKTLYKNNNPFYEHDKKALQALSAESSNFLPFLLKRFNVPAA
mgnify:CR=1 FL=1